MIGLERYVTEHVISRGGKRKPIDDKDSFIEYLESLDFEEQHQSRVFFDKSKNQYLDLGTMLRLRNAKTGKIYDVWFNLYGTRYMLHRISNFGSKNPIDLDEFVAEIEK